MIFATQESQSVLSFAHHYAGRCSDTGQPSDSESRWSEILTLNARRSNRCDTPLFLCVSYRLPASTYTPTAWKCPGDGSVTTRNRLGSVVTVLVGGKVGLEVEALRVKADRAGTTREVDEDATDEGSNDLAREGVGRSMSARRRYVCMQGKRERENRNQSESSRRLSRSSKGRDRLRTRTSTARFGQRVTATQRPCS